MALQERAGKKVEFLCVDENAECLELAQAKATATNEQTQFSQADSIHWRCPTTSSISSSATRR
jgi:ubiquinone/menaquinone biosynthesis C-methylase UbiE